MTLYLTEQEMLDRYCDSLKRASSRAVELTTSKLNKKPRLFIEFIDAIKTAAGSAHQMAHSQMNTKWLDTRDILEGIFTVSEGVTTFTDKDNSFWLQIKIALDNMIITGKSLATSKSMGRQIVLANLDSRQKNIQT